MLVSDDIPNIVNGVSQQAPTLRLTSQGELQEDCISSVQDGLTRRPGSRHLARLTTFSWENAFTHTINRDTTERYMMIVVSGQLRVFDLVTYESRTVNTPDGLGYLSDTSKGFAAVSIADYTFLVNKSVKTSMASDTSPVARSESLITILGLAYFTNYQVRIDGVIQAEYLTPGPNDNDEARQSGAEYVANELRTTLSTNLGAGWLVSRNGPTIRIRKLDGTPFTTRVDDHTGGTLVKITTAQTQNFASLPGVAYDGFITEIIGTDGTGLGTYFVKFEASGADGTGVWKETLKPGLRYKIDPATMPHVLVREANGSFTFKRAEWADRLVGDGDSVPAPSFLGKTIADVFFFRNRLGFLAEENTILTRAGAFFNFWPETATQQLDDDPIDLAGTHTKVSMLQFAVPYDQRLVAFSDQTQFILEGGSNGLLTPKTASFLPATEFNNSTLMKPISTGTGVLFATPRGAWTGIQEYYLREDSGQNDADDTTAHCQKYIPGNVFSITASTTENIVAVLSKDDPTRVYVYTYYKEGEQKLQSSWSRWNFRCNAILSAEIVGTNMFLLLQRGDGVYLEVLPIESGARDEGSEMLYRVDRKFYETSLSGATFDGQWTTFTLPFPISTAHPMWVFTRPGDTVYPEGYVLVHDRPSTTSIRVRGDHRTTKLCLGTRFTSRYQFSPFFARRPTQSGSIAQNKGRLQIRFVAVEFSDTGYFEVEVAPTGDLGPSYTYVFSGYVLGVTVPGSAAQLHTKNMQAAVGGRNTEAEIVLKSDHFTPFHFTSASWEGNHSPRARSL